MNRTTFYAKISEEEAKTVDRIVRKLGYSNRTELLTSMIHSLIYDKTFHETTDDLNEIIHASVEMDAIRRKFMEILDEYAFPVIAMHGPDYAFKVLAEDLQTWMYEKCQAVPQFSDMKEWVRLYYTMKKGEILRYRIAQTTARYAEDHDIEEEE